MGAAAAGAGADTMTELKPFSALLFGFNEVSHSAALTLSLALQILKHQQS